MKIFHGRITILCIYLSLVISSCNVIRITPSSTPTFVIPSVTFTSSPTLTKTPTLTPLPTATFTPTLTPIPRDTPLAIAIFSETGKPPEKEATVIIYARGVTVDIGVTTKGMFGVILPEGIYDVAILYYCRPSIGYLVKDVEVSYDHPPTVAFRVPAPGQLKVTVITENSSLARKSYNVFVSVDDEIVFSDNGSSNPRLLDVDRTDLKYNVKVLYSGMEIKTDNIQLIPDETREITITLPYNEATLGIYLLTPDGIQITENTRIVIKDKNDKVIVDNFYVRGYGSFVLVAGVEYTLQILYKGQLIQEKIITLEADQELNESFTITP